MRSLMREQQISIVYLLHHNWQDVMADREGDEIRLAKPGAEIVVEQVFLEEIRDELRKGSLITAGLGPRNRYLKPTLVT